jgi:hypothetical protein
MSRAFVTKTGFTSGEIDPLLLGRLDLRAQEDGAARLRNVVVHPTGGVSRRPGLRLLTPLPGVLRLIGYDGPDSGELLAFGEHQLQVVKDGTVVATPGWTPWDARQVAELSCARWGERLFLCHPDVPPHVLMRGGPAAWRLSLWAWETEIEGAGSGRELMPFVKFAAPETALQLDDGTGQPIAAGSPVRIWAGEPVFTAQHVDTLLRVKGRHIRIVNTDPLEPQAAIGLTLEPLPDGRPTRDWAEQAFSPARGWPANVAVHQERLVIGGSRDLPDRLWFSRTGHPLDFDPGEGEADAAFSFRLTGEEHHAIRGLVPGRELQVFTRGGEWVVPGAILKPENVQAQLQTRIGSFAERRIEPIDVDGATLFIGASGRELRELLYADSEQAYQAADIALLSRHLLDRPVAMGFDRHCRRLLIVRGDGRLATVTIDRNSNVVAWSLLESSGAFRAVAFHRGEPHFLVELDGRMLLERFEDGLGSDHAVTLASEAPSAVWAGLDHLEGCEAVVQPIGGEPIRATVAAGAVTLPVEAAQVVVGAAYTHLVEPAPLVVPSGAGVGLDRPYRPVRVTFRLLDSSILRADTGSGRQRVPLPAAAGGGRFSGDVAVRALGWRRGAGRPPWRVSQDDPASCTILAVTTEIMGDA